jgi:hypothetical protein
MERHLKALNTVLDDVDALQRNVEQSKFAKGEELEAVAEWGAELDGEIGKTDEAITALKNAITEVRSNLIIKEKEKEHALKEKEHEEQLVFEKPAIRTEIRI